MNVGDTVEAKITGTDRKTHTITLSMKSKEAAPKKVAAASPKATKKKEKSADASPLKTTLGDLFKEKMNGNEGEK